MKPQPTYNRCLNLQDLLEKKSHLLLGPRGTGKTYLIRNQLKDKVLMIDLLKSDFYVRLAARPATLEEIVKIGRHQLVVIDEVQKIPELLNEVHRLIESYGIRFLLTGSSARKLRHGGANLLGGRAWTADIFPLTSSEIPDLDLLRYLRFGGLPAVYLSQYPEEELHAYVNTYLIEEIAAEGIIRNLPRFSHFLQKAALSNGELLNFSEIASDVGISPSTVREYYRILEDTLVGYLVEPFKIAKSRKEISTAKFYFFDVGVSNTLRSVKTIEEGTDYFGRVFEQFIAQEIRAALSYQRTHLKLQFWRTHQQQEVDFIVGDILAIEVKATNKASSRMTKGLSAFAKAFPVKHRCLVSKDPVARMEDGVYFLPYTDFLIWLWSGTWREDSSPLLNKSQP